MVLERFELARLVSWAKSNDCRSVQTVKDNCNPVYDETFEYVISMAELHSRQLEVTVLTQKTWKSPMMGQVTHNFHIPTS